MSSKPAVPQDESQGSMELFLVILVSVLFPPILLFGFFIVNPRQELVVLRFGKFVTTIKSQGIRWIHPVGRTLHRISTKDNTLDIATATVVEINGNPIDSEKHIAHSERNWNRHDQVANQVVVSVCAADASTGVERQVQDVVQAVAQCCASKVAALSAERLAATVRSQRTRLFLYGSSARTCVRAFQLARY